MAVVYEYNGEIRDLAGWAKRAGISYSTLRHRVRESGMTIAQAIETPVATEKSRWQHMQDDKPASPRPPKLYTVHGKTMSLNDWAKELGLSRTTIEARMRRGMPLEEAFVAADRRGGWRWDARLGEYVVNGREPKLYTAHGKTMTLKEWAAELGVHSSALSRRLARSLSPEEALVSREKWHEGDAERRRRSRTCLEAEARAAEEAARERLNARLSEMTATAREIITNFAFPALGKMPIRALMQDADGGTAILEGDAGGELVYRVTVRDSGKNRIEAIGRKSGLTFCARDFWETVMIQPRADIAVR